MRCASCGTDNPGDARFCKSCGAALAPAAATEKAALPPWPTAGQPYRPAATTARPAAVPSPSTAAPSGLLVACGIYFLLAAILAVLGAAQLAIGAPAFGAINLAVATLYGLVGYWIMRREERGYSWGFWSAILSIVLTVAQSVTGPNLLIALVPFYAVAAVILWTNRAAFGR